MLTVTGGGGVMVINALPVLVGSATLAAVRVTVLGIGWLSGARKSTTDSLPDGGAQGLEDGAQTCPTVELPFATPLTAQVTARFDVPVTVAVKVSRCPTGMEAEAGETVTMTGVGFTMVTVAEADCAAAVA